MHRNGLHRENRLYHGVALAEELLRLPPDGDVVACIARSPGREGANEDSAAVIATSPNGLVLAVADGLGGHSHGQHASRIALEALRRPVVSAAADTGRVREAILRGFDEANRAVLALGNGAATTLAVIEICGGVLRSYHVGDSGALVFGGRGKIKLQTIFHSPVGYAVEAGMMDQLTAMEHEDRHLISNVVGDPAMHVGMSSAIRLRQRDTVVVASDGLFDNMYTDEIVERLRRGPLERSAHELFAEVRERMSNRVEGQPGKPDDLTIVVFRPDTPVVR